MYVNTTSFQSIRGNKKIAMMNKTSKKTNVTGLISICLWVIGSIYLFRVING